MIDLKHWRFQRIALRSMVVTASTGWDKKPALRISWMQSGGWSRLTRKRSKRRANRCTGTGYDTTKSLFKYCQCRIVLIALILKMICHSEFTFCQRRIHTPSFIRLWQRFRVLFLDYACWLGQKQNTQNFYNKRMKDGVEGFALGIACSWFQLQAKAYCCSLEKHQTQTCVHAFTWAFWGSLAANPWERRLD